MREHRIASGLAIVALSFSLGVGSMALASHLVVTRSDIVKNAVNGDKVAKNTLTGKDIREGSLDQVRRAARVDGSSIRPFAGGGAHLTNGPLVSLGGLQISYTCGGTDDAPISDVTLRSSVPNANVVVGRVTGAEGFGSSGTLGDPDLDPGETMEVGGGFGHLELTYTTPTGRIVSGHLEYATFNMKCHVHGVLVGA